VFDEQNQNDEINKFYFCNGGVVISTTDKYIYPLGTGLENGDVWNVFQNGKLFSARYTRFRTISRVLLFHQFSDHKRKDVSV